KPLRNLQNCLSVARNRHRGVDGPHDQLGLGRQIQRPTRGSVLADLICGSTCGNQVRHIRQRVLEPRALLAVRGTERDRSSWSGRGDLEVWAVLQVLDRTWRQAGRIECIRTANLALDPRDPRGEGGE